jgi:hypothetical protein
MQAPLHPIPLPQGEREPDVVCSATLSLYILVYSSVTVCGALVARCWECNMRSLMRWFLLALFFFSLNFSVAFQQTALGLLLAWWVYSCWQDGSLLRSPLDRPLLIFLAALLVSTLLSPDPLSSLLGYRKLWLVGAFFATYHLVKDTEEAERLVALLVTFGALVAAYGIVQHFTGLDLARQLVGKESNLDPFWFGSAEGFRTKGFHPSGISYAHNVLFPLIFATSLLLSPTLAWRRRAFIGGCCVLMLLSLLYSLTRGTWIAYVAALVLLGVTRGSKAGVGALGILVGLALFIVSMGGGVQLRAEKAFDWMENIGRSQVWQANLDMVRERPLFGWGYGNYKKFRDPYYQRYPKADTTAHAHNNFLQIWVDAGLIGLGAFLALFWAMLRLGWQAYRSLPESVESLRGVALGGLLSIIGFLVGGLTQYNFGDAEVVIVMWATAGLLMRMNTEHVVRKT